MKVGIWGWNWHCWGIARGTFYWCPGWLYMQTRNNQRVWQLLWDLPTNPNHTQSTVLTSDLEGWTASFVLQMVGVCRCLGWWQTRCTRKNWYITRRNSYMFRCSSSFHDWCSIFIYYKQSPAVEAYDWPKEQENDHWKDGSGGGREKTAACFHQLGKSIQVNLCFPLL